MPLIVLGLIVIVGIIIYALVRYAGSDDEPIDLRPVRERYSHVFEKMKENMQKGANYTVVEDDEDEASGAASSKEDGNTMYFPDDAEVQKRKRNIH